MRYSVCLRVCKEWRRTLTSPLHCQLWRTMTICSSYYRRAPDIEDLKRIILWAGDGGVRKIRISMGSPIEFTFTQAMLTLLLKASPSLENLEVSCLRLLSFPSNEKIWKRLRYFSIASCAESYHTAADRPGGFPQKFLENAASSLEHLHLSGIPQYWYNRVSSLPILPNLKILKIGDYTKHMVDPDDRWDALPYPDAIPFPIVCFSRPESRSEKDSLLLLYILCSPFLILFSFSRFALMFSVAMC